MGWKGALRTARAAARRYEREQKRRQRELEKVQKQQQKLLEKERAAHEVAVFENQLDILASLHLDIEEPVDWKALTEAPEPQEPLRLDRHEKQARDDLKYYKPSFADKIFKRRQEKLLKLESEVELARSRDASEYDEALKQYKEAYDEWAVKKDLATKVLACEPEACLAALDELSPFEEISGLGSGIEFSINNDDSAVLSATIKVHGEEIIPQETKYLLKSGALSTKAMPKGEFYGLYQDYVCSCSLRVAGEIFAAIPVAIIIVNAIEHVLNTATGQLEEQPILSAVIPRSSFELINLAKVDPSDSMGNFIHNMSFLKTKGFKPVESISYEEIPSSLKQLGPQLPSPSWVESLAELKEQSANIPGTPTKPT